MTSSKLIHYATEPTVLHDQAVGATTAGMAMATLAFVSYQVLCCKHLIWLNQGSEVKFSENMNMFIIDQMAALGQ